MVVRRMLARLKYSWSVLKLACALVFATNVYLLLRLFARENVVYFMESKDVTAGVRHVARHPFIHLMPSQDSLRGVQKCTQPKLSLSHDALSFAFQPMPPLSCNGSTFFYLHNGYLIPNTTSGFRRKLKMCEVYAIKRESDSNSYLQKLFETNVSTSVKVNEDFIYVRCFFYDDSDGGELSTDAHTGGNDSQLDIRQVQDKPTLDTRLGVSQEDSVKLVSNREVQGKLNLDVQFGTRQDEMKQMHRTHLPARQEDIDKMVHDTRTSTRQDKVKVTHDMKHMTEKQDKIAHDTELEMKQDKIAHDTQLEMKQDKIAHDTQLGPRQGKVKRDISMIDVNNSASSYVHNKTIFFKNQNSNFNQTQQNVNQSFVISKQNSPHIANREISSKRTHSARPYRGSEELIQNNNPTFDENKHSVRILSYLEHNISVHQNTSTSQLEQTRKDSARFQLHLQTTEHRSVRNNLVESIDGEVEPGNVSFTSSRKIAVDEKVARNKHAEETLPNTEVEKYGDFGGGTEPKDLEQRGVDESYTGFITERDEMFDGWEWRGQGEEYRNSEEIDMLTEFPVCNEEQLLVQVSPLKHVFDRYSASKAAETSGLNVLMFGIDSMSNMAVQRKLPELLNFLKKDLDAVIFEGYNIVGDGTTQALLPMFLGQLQHEIPDILNIHLDHLDFVWKRYQQRGYVTLFAEDEPHLGVFNLRLKGFEDLPTDHYMRYFWQSRVQSQVPDCSAKYCTGSTPNHHYLLQYLSDFFHKYPSIPRFAIGFSGELSHDEVNPSQYLDTDLLKFLMDFKAEGYLNNTVLIVFADHGSRKGKIRQTLQGKIEERLPFMSMVFPRSFRKKHRVLFENLKRNARGLTTPFDVHKTLLDILDLSKVYRSKQEKAIRGVSLFRSIPENRTCSQAGIDTHWCTCVQEVPVPKSDPIVKEAAEAVVATINNLTQADRHQCALLQLSAIHSASLVMPNLEVLKFHKTAEDGKFSVIFSNVTFDMAEFQITLEMDKCGGVFEATVQVLFHQDGGESSGEPKLTYSAFEHAISRINTYGSQCACICKSNPNIMKFCCCERYLLGEKLANC